MSGGGGGGGQPTQSTVTQTNIPEYARPYVESMLGATMSQLFETEKIPGKAATPAVVDDEGRVIKEAVEATPERLEITKTRPYKPYSERAEDYFAVFSPEQQAAFREAAALTRPGGFGQAGIMASQAGQGGLDTTSAAMGYGGQGAQVGRQAVALGRDALGFGQAGADIGIRGTTAAEQGFGAGAEYARMATDPRSIQSYMSPYMQNVVDVQKQQAIRDYQEQVAPQQQAQAVRAGAFGGSRDAVQRAIAKRSLNQQLQNIQAQGQQQAFQQAQQAQQYGANLGLQGLQAGYQGLQTGMEGQRLGLQGVQGALAGTAQGLQGAQVGLQGVQGAQAGYGLAGQQAANLANIASQGQAADISRLGFQGQTAAQKQARDQAIVSQRIQDYAMEQQYPQQQLAFMNAMLRGLPMQAATTQSYMPAPNPYAQLIGSGAQMYGAGKLFGMFKEGGAVKTKRYAEGGITSIDQKVINDPTSYSPEMINKGINSGSISKMAGAIGLSAIENAKAQAQQQKGLTTPAPQGTILGDLQQQAMASQGIDTLPSGLPTQQLAGGGIIAFEDGGDVNEPIRFQNEGLVDMVRRQQAEDIYYNEAAPQSIEDLISAARRRRDIPLSDEEKAEREYYKKLPAELAKSRDINKAMAIAAMGSKMAQTRGPFATALAAGTEAGIPMLAAGEKEYRTGMGELMKGMGALGRAQRAETIKGIEAGEAEARSAQDRILRERQITSQAEIAKLDRENRLAIANIPDKALQVASKLMKDNPGMTYLEAVSQASQALTPRDTYNATRNAVSAAAKDANAEFLSRATFDPKLQEDMRKAAQGDKAAQARVDAIRNKIQQDTFRTYQVQGVDLSGGRMGPAPTAGGGGGGRGGVNDPLGIR